MNSARTALPIAVLAIAALACNTASALLNPPTETLVIPTDTPVPTSTPLPTPDFTATAQARVTEDYLSALELVAPVLESIGVSTDNGRLAWSSARDITIVADEFNSLLYDDIDSDLALKNFVLSADVTWETETGISGCGFILRADDDIQRGEQIHFIALRLSGLPIWELDLFKFGAFQASLHGGAQASNAISVSNNSTNHFVILARDATITAYANDIRLGAGTTPASRDKGQFGFFAFQDTGQTTCTFSNAWIWELPD